jgi:hypothetical protein
MLFALSVAAATATALVASGLGVGLCVWIDICMYRDERTCFLRIYALITHTNTHTHRLGLHHGRALLGLLLLAKRGAVRGGGGCIHGGGGLGC